MTKLRLIPALLAAAIALPGSAALAAGAEGHVEDIDFSFEGPFGTFDPMQLQRGFQVFTEVCAGCHGMKYLAFRNLTEDRWLAFAGFASLRSSGS